MGANLEVELKLLETYRSDVAQWFDSYSAAVMSQGKKSSQQWLDEYLRRLQIYERQLQHCRGLAHNDNRLIWYEAVLAYFHGNFRVSRAAHLEAYGGLFSANPRDELKAAITYFENSLQLYEQPGPRWGIDACYRLMGDKKTLSRHLIV